MPLVRIEHTILVLRGERVILDADLAALYGVTTKAFNQAVKRNADRFPADFRFQLSEQEKIQVVTDCDHLKGLRYSPTRPWAFTEHGALMAANVLNSKRAIEASVMVVRAFVRLRQMLISHGELAQRLAELERKYDAQFKVVFDAIRELMEPPPTRPKVRIGFRVE